MENCTLALNLTSTISKIPALPVDIEVWSVSWNSLLSEHNFPWSMMTQNKTSLGHVVIKDYIALLPSQFVCRSMSYLTLLFTCASHENSCFVNMTSDESRQGGMFSIQLLFWTRTYGHNPDRIQTVAKPNKVKRQFVCLGVSWCMVETLALFRLVFTGVHAARQQYDNTGGKAG